MPHKIPIDPKLAGRAEKLFRRLGLDLPTAMNMFLLQALREQGLPFTPSLRPAPAARAAVQENEPEHGNPESLPFQEDGAPSSKNPAVEENGIDDLPAGPAEAPGNDEDTQPASPRPAHDSCGEDEHDPGLSSLIGMPLKRIRSLNRIYAIGEPNPQVAGWREASVAGDEPFALDFESVRLELGCRDGGTIRMMDGRLPDEVLESDAICPRDLSAVFSAVMGRPLLNFSASPAPGTGEGLLQLHFAGGAVLTFSAAGEWCRLSLTDSHGAVLYAPDSVWAKALGGHGPQTLS